MISGFLDKEGVLYPCPSYAHMSLAEELVEKFKEFFEKHKNEFNTRQLADIEMLLKDFGDLYKYHNPEQALKGGE